MLSQILVAPSRLEPPSPVGKFKLGQSAKPVAEKQNGLEPAMRDEGQAASLRQAFFDQPKEPKAAVR